MSARTTIYAICARLLCARSRRVSPSCTVSAFFFCWVRVFVVCTHANVQVVFNGHKNRAEIVNTLSLSFPLLDDL